MEKKKKIIGTILIIFIVVCSVLLYIYRDIAFLNKMEIKYPDGCVEKYENGDLITPECIEGRILMKQQNNPIDNNVLIIPEK